MQTLEVMVPRKNLLLIAGSAGAGLLVLLMLLIATRSVFKQSVREPSISWNQEAIRATYVASQLRQIDKARSSLVLSYDLKNNTTRNYPVPHRPASAFPT